jgi:hypothetical protein
MAKKYLFHNVYGDADHLINTAPNDVECIPAGWSPEIENARNVKINLLGIGGVQGYPCLVYWENQKQVTFTIPEGGPDAVQTITRTLPAGWKVLGIYGPGKENWTWIDILNNINEGKPPEGTPGA